MALLWGNHPEIPSCTDCRAWIYTPEWKRLTRGNNPPVPVPRPAGQPSPCQKCPKGPTPFLCEPTPRTLAAIHYYQLCEVDPAGQLPRDAIVLENNALIRGVAAQVDRARLDLIPAMLETLR